jgi:flagellar motor switch protein FliM
MSEILTQEEIDSLLSAVHRGDLSRTTETTPRPHRQRAILPHDFRRPNRITKEHVRALQMLHDSFARTLGSSLSAYLRSLVEVQLTSVDQLTCGEFLGSVSSPSALGIFEMPPLKGGAVLEVSPYLVFPIIDRILGGTGRASIRVRDLTEIERGLVDRVFRRLLADLQQAWLPVGRFEANLLKLETNPQFVQLTSANEVAILITFEVRVGEAQGVMSLCLPFPLLEPVFSKLVAHRSIGAFSGAETQKVSHEVEGHVRNTSLNLRAVLAEVRVPIGDLSRLQPGDILPLPGKRELAVTVEVEGQPRFLGRAGRRQRTRAVEITAVLNGGGANHV